jgi:hypothetical protein
MIICYLKQKSCCAMISSFKHQYNHYSIPSDSIPPDFIIKKGNLGSLF